MRIHRLAVAKILAAAAAVLLLNVTAAPSATAQRVNDPCFPEVVVQGQICR